MKKQGTARIAVLLISLFALAIIAMSFAGCGNKDYFDTVRTYDRAIILLPNGEVVDTKIKAWRDYEDGEQLQITAEDGTVYLTNSFRCDLISSKEE